MLTSGLNLALKIFDVRYRALFGWYEFDNFSLVKMAEPDLNVDNLIQRLLEGKN